MPTGTGARADRGHSCDGCGFARAARPGRCPLSKVRRPAGTALTHQDAVPELIYLVRAGLVLLTSVSAGGDERYCAMRGPGSLVGLEALRGEACAFHGWALTDVRLCAIDGGGLRAWLGPLGTPMGALCAMVADEAARRVADRIALGGPSVSRVARFLAEHARAGDGARPLGVPKLILARMLAMRPETLSRSLATLRAAGAVARGRTLRVTDAEKLRPFLGDGAGR